MTWSSHIGEDVVVAAVVLPDDVSVEALSVDVESVEVNASLLVEEEVLDERLHAAARF